MAKMGIKSRLFRRMVLSYFAILSIPIVIFSSLFYNQVQKENHDRILEAREQSVSNIISVVDRKFFDVTSLGDRLLTVNWLQRARSDSAIISRYFDTTRKSDICQELLVHAASLGIADSLVVLLPQKNEAISTGAWGSIEEILSTAGIRDLNGQSALLELIQKPDRFQVLNAGECNVIPGSEDLLVLQSLDVLNDSRVVLLIRIGKASLDLYLDKFQFGDLAEFTFSDSEGHPIYHYQTTDTATEDYSSVKKSEIFLWNYQVVLKEASSAGLFEQFSTALTALLLSLLMGMLAAYLLAVLSYRPIRKLVSRIGGDRKQSEFQTISDALDRLTAEKEALNSMVEQYQNSARNNLLFNLLHGCFAEKWIQEQLDNYEIPYQDSQYFTVLIFRCAEVAREQRFTLFLNIKAGLLAEQVQFDLLETLDENVVAILRFSEPRGYEAAEPLMKKLSRYVREKMGVTLRISCGGEEKGLIGISKSYQIAKERIARQSFSNSNGERPAFSAARCYYPTDWELQLVNNLKLGNEEPAMKILRELRRENDRRSLSAVQQMKVVSMIFDTILRLMDELEMDPSEPVSVLEDSFGQLSCEKQWEYLESLVQQICGRTSYFSQPQADGTGAKILRYVDENFENSDLSLQMLGDQLGLSVSAISRAFKATVKINFYDYLCRIRMEKAKEYLRETEIPVAEVARKVGYENELSFKRAFVRYEGIKPREYRQNQQNENE